MSKRRKVIREDLSKKDTVGQKWNNVRTWGAGEGFDRTAGPKMPRQVPTRLEGP